MDESHQFRDDDELRAFAAKHRECPDCGAPAIFTERTPGHFYLSTFHSDGCPWKVTGGMDLFKDLD